jgi:hypothetical protein
LWLGSQIVFLNTNDLLQMKKSSTKQAKAPSGKIPITVRGTNQASVLNVEFNGSLPPL